MLYLIVDVNTNIFSSACIMGKFFLKYAYDI